MPKKTISVLAWLFICTQVFGETQDKVKSLKDNVSEGNTHRLYSYNPLGTYASANPHGAFSFQVPAVVSSNIAASHLVPVKTENLVVRNSNGFLKDSYGNRFVETPQSVAYKTVLPQQFVQLQDLPAHLSQPLLAVAPTYQYRIPSGQYGYGAPYKNIQFQSSPVLPLTNFAGQPRQQQYVYANNIRSSDPTSVVLSSTHGRPTPFHQSQNKESAPVKALRQHTNNNLIYANPQNYVQNSNIKHEPKSQRLEQSTQNNPYGIASNNLAVSENQAPKKLLPITQTFTTFVNGKKTIINLETRPPLPLLDISLLEPLTFSNPVVPQMQHYLPKIPMATYKKLPEYMIDQAHKHADAFLITNTKSYDSGINNDGPSNESPESQEQNSETSIEESSSESEEQDEVEPNQSDNEHADISEEKSPNYKETYNEKVVSYNKETKNEPTTYNYSKQIQNQPVEYTFSKQINQKPIHYTYIHDSNKPLLVKEIHYEEEDFKPKELVYKFNVDGKRNTPGITKPHLPIGSYNIPQHHSHQSPQHETHNPQQLQPNNHIHNSPQTQSNYQRHIQSQHQSKPQSKHQLLNEHQYQSQQQPQQQQQYQPQHQQQYQPQHQQQYQPQHQQQYQPHHQQQYHSQHQTQNRPHNQPNPEPYSQLQNNLLHQPQKNSYKQPHKEIESYHDKIPNDSSHLRLEHRSEQNNPHNKHTKGDQPKVFYESHPNQVTHNPTAKQVPSHVQTLVPKEYEENISLVSPHHPTVQPLYHHGTPKKSVKNHYNPLEEVQHKPANRQTHHSEQHVPVVHGTSKHLIVQDETPDERHVHDEKIMQEEVDHEDNSEEDFEKAYKNAAYGFPAFHKDSEEDDHRFAPETYGVPKYNAEFNIDDKAFQQYQQDGDEYPKHMRANYKDANDKTKENYYEEYSINKPESMLDRYQKQLDYYKMFRKQKPEYRENKPEVAKYTVAPSFIFSSKPKKKSKQFGRYESSPDSYEYDYAKEAPSDNTAYSTRAHQKTKSNTQFVEPQYQYGFEPLALPQFLDSELAAMASNDSPDSEKPLRKKIYTENFYLSKTKTSSGKPDS